MEKEVISIKGSQDGLIIYIEPNSGLSEMISALENKLKQSNGYFDGSKVVLTFSGKMLTVLEKHELLEVIRRNSKMDILSVKDFVQEEEKGNLEQNRQTDIKLKSKIVELNSLLSDAQSKKATFHHGTLRSGQSITAENTIVIMGDVNNGAIVNAGGSVIILGKLRGVVQCGLSGKANAFVFALEMRPTLLQIHNVYGRFEDSQSGASAPMIAYVHMEQIAIEGISGSVSKELEL